MQHIFKIEKFIGLIPKNGIFFWIAYFYTFITDKYKPG